MKKICVFCGSSPGSSDTYINTAGKLGKALAELKISLVYGGAKVGLMGHLASTVLENGGEVIGVIPRALAEREIAYTGISELHVVESMHERKALMADLSDGFIAMPGGLGTIEEIFEAWTWSQLRIHQKPCALLNIAGYYDKLLDFLNHAINQKFIKPEYRALMLIDSDVDGLLKQMQNYQPPPLPDKAQWARSMTDSI